MESIYFSTVIISSSSSSSSRRAKRTDSLGFLAILPYLPSFLLSPKDGTQCLQRTSGCKFLLVVSIFRNPLKTVVHQQCQAWLARLIWMICEIGGKWPYNLILEQFSFFSTRSVQPFRKRHFSKPSVNFSFLFFLIRSIKNITGLYLNQLYTTFASGEKDWFSIQSQRWFIRGVQQVWILSFSQFLLFIDWNTFFSRDS